MLHGCDLCFQKSLKSFYCVYVSNNAKPLYLDSDEEDSNYQYVYNNANDNYKTERTWKYNSLPCNGDEVDNYPKEDFNLYKDRDAIFKDKYFKLSEEAFCKIIL